jgi:hypothetical protein
MKPPSGMMPFYSQFPELAERETRVAFIPFPQAGLPMGKFAFVEHYCGDLECDCRRVLIMVTAQHDPTTVLATINFGWESEKYYANRLWGDHAMAAEIRMASLDPLLPQSESAGALLGLFQQIVQNDRAYVERLARHYRMFKEAITPSSTAKSDSQAVTLAPTTPISTCTVQPNLEKIDEAVLALLHLTSFTEGKGETAVVRARKGLDETALDRLRKKGFIAESPREGRCVVLTRAGTQQAKELFEKLFGQ